MDSTKKRTWPVESEVERLAAVYRRYRESEVVQARWDENNPGNRAIIRERRAKMRRLLDACGFLPLTKRRVLDVGCGSGKTLAGLLELGATPENLYGVDLLSDRVAEARRRFPAFQVQCANGERLDFPDAYFDLVTAFTLFSSILSDRMAANVSREIVRVLKPEGAVLWYDFRYNNPRNPHVRGMTQARIHHLFPKLRGEMQTLTLAPPLARRLGRSIRLLYPVLAAVPILRTHYLGLLTKCAILFCLSLPR